MGLFGAKKHSIGKTIAELRKAKGWTQAELAEKLQVSDKAVSKWEKDSGAPSIEFFPAIAEIFGVSIDYIMTGKEPEKEVVTISKAELCAKSDDPSMLDSIDIEHKDEQGKSLLDYILQYQSFKVFIKLCESQKENIAKFPILDAIKLSILTNRLDLLRGTEFSLGKSYYPRWTFETEKELLSLLPKAEETGFKDSKFKDLCVLTDDILAMIVCDKRINEDTLNILLGKQSNRQCVWYHTFPYLIHQSYLNKEGKMLRRLLTLSVENNQYAYDKMKLVLNNYNGRLNYVPNFFFMAEYGNKGHGLVRILEETIKLALEKGDFALFKEFDDLNRAIQAYYDFKPYIASDYEIKMAKLKADKSVSQEELTIQSTIHDGIINIDELLATNNLPLIKKALSTHDIHPIEPLCRMFQDKQWRALFEYAVDSKNDGLARAVIKDDEKLIEKEITSIYLQSCKYMDHWGAYAYGERIGQYPRVNGQELKLRNDSSLSKNGNQDLRVVQVLEYLNMYRQQVISDYSFEEEKIKAVNELTKEYFETELKKGNAEIVIIKLCVRLEAIFRSSYHYEGDFSEMLDKYCSQHGQEDDGWGYNQEAKFVKYLQKLRMCRNSIVHAEKKKDMLALEEIQYCIDYICNLK